MEILNNILLWLHFIGLVMGGAALVSVGVMSRLPVEARAGFGPAARMLGGIGRGGLGLLIVTGPLMLWLKWGGVTPSAAWFGIKMVFVLIVIVAVIVFGIEGKRAATGNERSKRISERARIIASVALVLTVLAAVFTFG